MGMTKSGLVLPRRKALLGAATLAATPLAMPHIARAADPIRIGLLLAKTGGIAAQTEYLANGTYIALEQRNNMINGQPAELIWLDEPSPQGSTQNMQKLVQENKVCAILGGSLSSNALAEEAKAAELKIPFVCDNAAATEITGKNCNRYTFRLNTPVVVQSRILAPYALSYGKKWYHITASFAFGQDILRSSRELLKAAGGTEVGFDEDALAHGEAVAIGCVFVAEVAHRVGLIGADTLRRHREAFGRVGLPVGYAAAPFADLLATMRVDKKSRGAQLRLIVLEEHDGGLRPRVLAGPDEQLLAEAYQALEVPA